MSTAMTWGAQAVPQPNPDGIIVKTEHVGLQRRTGDGTMRSDIIAEKVNITVTWGMLTEAEYDALVTVYDTYAFTSSALVIPTSGDSYNVVVLYGSYQASLWYDVNDTPYYDVTMTFVEA